MAEFKSIGVNMYIGFFGDLDQASLSSLAASQMPLVPDQNSVGLTGSGNSTIQGWDQTDEPDNAQPNGSGGYGPCIPPSQIIASYQAIRSNDVTRPIMLNFGRGVSDINYGGRGSCTGNTNYYTQASPGGDILSFDIYPISDYNGRLEMVAAGVDNLRAQSGNTKTRLEILLKPHRAIHGGTVPLPESAGEGGSDNRDVPHSWVAWHHVFRASIFADIPGGRHFQLSHARWRGEQYQLADSFAGAGSEQPEPDQWRRGNINQFGPAGGCHVQRMGRVCLRFCGGHAE